MHDTTEALEWGRIKGIMTSELKPTLKLTKKRDNGRGDQGGNSQNVLSKFVRFFCNFRP